MPNLRVTNRDGCSVEMTKKADSVTERNMMTERQVHTRRNETEVARICSHEGTDVGDNSTVTEVIEQRRVEKVIKTHHKIQEDEPMIHKKIIDITIHPVDDAESFVINKSSKELNESIGNGGIKESMITKKVHSIKDQTEFYDNGTLTENHHEMHNGHGINNTKIHASNGEHLVKLDNTAIQKQIVNVAITPVEEENYEEELKKSETINKTRTIITSERNVNENVNNSNHLKVVKRNEFDTRSVELNQKPPKDNDRDSRSVCSVGDGKHWEIKSIKSIEDEFRLVPKLNPEQESLEKVENYLKSQDSNFILVNDSKIENIQHPPGTVDNFIIENRMGKNMNLNINYIKSVDGDNKSARSNSFIINEKWTEYHPQKMHSSTSEIEIKEPGKNLSFTIDKVQEYNYTNNTVKPKERERPRVKESSTVEMKIHSPKPEIDFVNIEIYNGNEPPVRSDSVKMKKEWVEYKQLPVETNHRSEIKRDYNSEILYPIGSTRSKNSNAVYFNNKLSDYKIKPTETSSFEQISKGYSSKDLCDTHNSYVPSMYNTGQTGKSDSVTMKEEWTEFLTVPIFSTSANSITQKENPKSNATYPYASKIYDHYSYRYEDPIKTEKLQNLASTTLENAPRTYHSSERVVQALYDSLSKKHKPMLPSTDCLKQTFHVDHEDEELLQTPIIYDANGERIENLSETNNFKSVTEYVTLRISDLKALIKIEISVEMFHNINPIEDNWKRKTVRLTRMIELDLSKIKDSRKLQNIMKRCRMDKPQISWTDENGSVVDQYNQENVLTGKETFDVFFNLLSITHEEEEQCQPSKVNKDEFYLTRSPSGQITNVPCEPQYLINGYSNVERSYLYY